MPGMTIQSVIRKKRTWLIGIPILLFAVFVGGPYIYIHFIEGDPPAKLALAKVKTTKAASTTSTSLDGTWNATTGSAVQYRVGEVLFGQGTTAVGKTTAVTGNLSISGTTVPADGKQITVKATGNLTLRGQTKAVTFDIIAQRDGATISANGTIPIVFDDYQIPAPSFGPAQVENHGELVFLINFTAA